MKFLSRRKKKVDYGYTLLYINLDKRVINHPALQTLRHSIVVSGKATRYAKYDDFVYRYAGVQGGQKRSGGWRFETGNRVVSVLRGEPSGSIDLPLDIQ